MTWIAVVKQDDEGRITKFLDFATEAEAVAHVAKVSDTFPDAFASEAPEGGIRDFKADRGALVSDPIVDVEPTAHEKRVKAYKDDLGEDALVNVIREVEAIVGTPKTEKFQSLVAKIDAIDAKFPL
tara:strand:+ start:159 stop:536 length:378 start_codon:yes stop_codon:yes gene_type:complete